MVYQTNELDLPTLPVKDYLTPGTLSVKDYLTPGTTREAAHGAQNKERITRQQQSTGCLRVI